MCEIDSEIDYIKEIEREREREKKKRGKMEKNRK